MTSNDKFVQDDSELRFREALRFHPDSPKVLANFAAYLVAQKRNHDEAELLLERALTLDPNNPERLLEYGAFLEKIRGLSMEAEPFYRRAVELVPDSPEAVKALAHVAPENAREALLRPVVERNPQDGEAVLALTRSLDEESDDEAVSLLRAAINCQNPDPHCCRRLAEILESQEESSSEALQLFIQAAELHPECPDCVNAATDAAVRSQFPEVAFRWCERSLQVNGTGFAPSVFPEIMRWADTHPKDVERIARQFLEGNAYSISTLRGLLALLEARHQDDEVAHFTQRLQAARLFAEVHDLCCESCYASWRGGTVEKYREILDRCCRGAMELAPDWSRPVRSYAHSLAHIPERHEEAEKAYQRYLELEPDDAFIRSLFAEFMCETQKNAEVAERLYRHALADNPDEGQALRGLGRLLWHQGKLDEAETLLRRGADVEPSSGSAAGLLAEFLLSARQEQGPSTASLCLRASRQSPGRPEYAEKAALLRDEAAEQERLFRAALKVNGKNPDLLYDHARVLRTMDRQQDETISVLRQVLELNPRHWRATSELARLLDATGQVDEAGTMYRRAVELEPTHSFLLYHLAVYLDRYTDRLDETELFYRRSLEALPGYGNALYRLALLLLTKRDDPGLAWPFFERAREALPHDAGVLADASFCLWRLNRTEEAVSLLQTARTLDAENVRVLWCATQMQATG